MPPPYIIFTAVMPILPCLKYFSMCYLPLVWPWINVIMQSEIFNPNCNLRLVSWSPLPQSSHIMTGNTRSVARRRLEQQGLLPLPLQVLIFVGVLLRVLSPALFMNFSRRPKIVQLFRGQSLISESFVVKSSAFFLSATHNAALTHTEKVYASSSSSSYPT